MNLIDLFSILYVTTPFAMGLIDGGKETGIIGVLVGLFVGLLLGIGGVLGFRALVATVVRLEKNHPKSARFFWFPAGLWIVVSGLLAGYITKFFIHYVVH
jgi:hypothetical protein